MAPSARVEGDGWLMSHLTFDATDPGTCIRATAQALGVTESQSSMVVAAIADANIALASALRDAAGGSGAADAVLRRAAERQIEVIGSTQHP